MVHCSVIKCTNNNQTIIGGKKMSLYRLPAIETRCQQSEISKRRRSKWLANISCKIKGDLRNIRVCSAHFLSGKPSSLLDETNIDWAPTVNLGHNKFNFNSKIVSIRADRARHCNLLKTNKSNKDKHDNSKAGSIESTFEDATSVFSDNLNTRNPDNPYQSFINKDQIGDETTSLPIPDCESVLETTESDTVILLRSMVADLLYENEEHKQEKIRLQQALDTSLKKSYELEMKNEELMSKLNCLESKIRNIEEALLSTSLKSNAFIKNPEKVKFYTGLPNFEILQKIYAFIEPNLSSHGNSLLSKFEQMMIVFLKLRLNLRFQDIAYRLDVSLSTITSCFSHCLYVMYVRLEHLVFWLDRECLRSTMPQSFKSAFGDKVTVIIDCFEIFIQRPSDFLARSATWSNYKHHNTVKFLIGISPTGMVAYISKAWAGRTSDKFITENSSFLNNILPGDLILADRGFTVTDAVAIRQAHLNLPAFTRGKNQLAAIDVENTRKIANVRIHVERIIGSIRQKHSILQETIGINHLQTKEDVEPYIDQILSLSCCLSNLCDSIVT